MTTCSELHLPGKPKLRWVWSWLVLAGLCLGAGTSAEAAFGYRKPLTIQGARVSGAPHTDFPVLISLVDPNLRTTPAGRVTSPTGCDIAFMASTGGALLDHEIERYDGATGTLVAWVRIPSLTAANATIFIYYGDPEITCAQNNPRNVWDTNFRYVYHFSETAGNPLDSTANMVAATLNPQGDPAAVENRNAPGQIAGSLEFTTPPAPPPATFQQTTDSHLTLADGVLPANQPFTIEGWFNATTWGAAGTFIGLVTKGRDSAPGFVDWVGIDKVPSGANARLSLIMQLPEGNVDGGTNLPASTWIYATVTFDGASARRVYLNGVLDGSDLVTATTVNAIVENTRVGDDSNGNYLNGRVDEIRFSNVLRSAGWIQTTFDNSSCPSTSTCGVVANRFVTEGTQEIPPTNYRSIGDTTTPYVTGTVTATNGSATVTGSGTAWRTANRGRGDAITIGVFTGTILSVDSETQLTLTSTYTGVTGSGLGYSINRKFADLASWEDCIDGGSSPCGPDPVIASSNLVTGDRREVGIVYKDKVYVDTVLPLGDDVLIINGSTTGPFHTITLTADAGNRHNGIPGSGVIIDAGGASVESENIHIGDSFTTVEWMEVRNSVASADGIAVGAGATGRVVVRNDLVHNIGDRGIQVHGADHDVDIYNNFVYQVFRGIRVEDPLNATATARILNNTVFSSISAGAPGISGVAPVGGTPVTVSNNISHSNAGGDFGVLGLNPASSNNLAGDLTGIAHSPAGGGINSVPLTGAGGVNFFNTTPGAENLHIQGTSVAKDTGADLSCFLRRDIDGVSRLTPWEIGADDISQTTAVTLQSFEAVGLDGAVDLSWRTGSELNNLGFHLYRSTSADDPYERITASVIPGLGSSALGASYSYRDAGLFNGVTHFYRLEDIETTGQTKLHGPVSATPQAGAVAAAPPSSGGSGGSSGSSGGSGSSSPASRITYGDPSLNVLRVTRQGPSQVVLELVTEGFTAVPQAEGSVRIEVPGFGDVSGPGSPSIPSKRTWVEALAGRRVRIGGVRALDVASFAGLRPVAAGSPEMVVGRDGTVRAGLRRRGEGAAFRRAGLYPEEPARVVEVAFQGEVKKALVELSPLRWDAASRQLLLAKRLLVRVILSGVEPSERSLGGSRGRRLRRAPGTSGTVLSQLVVRGQGLYGELRGGLRAAEAWGSGFEAAPEPAGRSGGLPRGAGERDVRARVGDVLRERGGGAESLRGGGGLRAGARFGRCADGRGFRFSFRAAGELLPQGGGIRDEPDVPVWPHRGEGPVAVGGADLSGDEDLSIHAERSGLHG